MKKILVYMLVLTMCMTGLAAAKTEGQPKLQQDILVLL